MISSLSTIRKENILSSSCAVHQLIQKLILGCFCSTFTIFCPPQWGLGPLCVTYTGKSSAPKWWRFNGNENGYLYSQNMFTKNVSSNYWTSRQNSAAVRGLIQSRKTFLLDSSQKKCTVFAWGWFLPFLQASLISFSNSEFVFARIVYFKHSVLYNTVSCYTLYGACNK